MLVRAAKHQSFDGFREAAKQLLVWTFSRKRGFHSTCWTDCYSNYRDRGFDEDHRDKNYRDRDRNSYGDRNRGYRDRNRRYSRKSSQEQYNEFCNTKKVEFDKKELRQLKNNFYTPHPNVVNRPESEIKNFYKKHDLHFFGGSADKCPRPIFSFDELDLPVETQNLIRELKYSEPTPIQSQTWPIALSGLNMVGVAQTGSGKTLGFVLPGLVHIKHQPPLERGDGPIAIVISPTRELAQQTDAVFSRFARSYLFRTACVFGGASKLSQAEKLSGAHICIGTPGRIIDFLNSSSMELSRCTYCVLDEADRLLDMGFEPQINAILNNIRPDRQMLMWSATWPKKVEDLALTHLKDFVGVRFGSSELTVNSNITQRIHVCEKREKQNLLLKLLKEISEQEDSKTLVFAQTKFMTYNLCNFLKRNGFRVEYINSDKTQIQRNATLGAFRSSTLKILVGTSVVSRGLDITDISHVINFDFPQDIEEYVHIIGRTGRHNRKGTAHTLFTPEEARLAPDLIKILNQANQEVNPELTALLNTSSGFRTKESVRERSLNRSRTMYW